MAHDHDESERGQRFEEFLRFYSQAQSAPTTGDAGLDVLLLTSAPWFADLVRALAVPHWFDDASIRLLAANVASETSLEDVVVRILGLTFVRHHPLGYTYHDAVRAALLSDLMQRAPERVREVGRIVDAHLVRDVRPRDDGEHRQVEWERMYHQLAYDEPAGLARFAEHCEQACVARRLTDCETILGMAREQAPLLSETCKTAIAFWSARLSFERRQWEDSERQFAQLLEQSLNGQTNFVRLYYGLTLEALSKWPQAERVYRASLPELDNTVPMSALGLRLEQRLANTRLRQGDLDEAEERGRATLQAARAIGDMRAQAESLEILGRTYGELRDLEQATRAYQEGADLLRRINRGGDRARLFSSLADLYTSFNRFDEAERLYTEARQIKQQSGDTYGMAFVIFNLGSLQLRRGRPEAALQDYRDALQVFRQFKDRVHTPEVLRAMGLAYEQLDRLPAAAEYVRDALEALPPDDANRPTYLLDLERLEKKIDRSARRRPFWRRFLS